MKARICGAGTRTRTGAAPGRAAMALQEELQWQQGRQDDDAYCLMMCVLNVTFVVEPCFIGPTFLVQEQGLPLLVFTADLDLLPIQLRHAVNAKRGITHCASCIIYEDDGEDVNDRERRANTVV
ncbi:uncharacterized protein V6R79_000034 [Siganus canaliculatus]